MLLFLLTMTAIAINAHGVKTFIKEPSDVYTDSGNEISIPCINNLNATTRRATWIVNNELLTHFKGTKYQYFNKHLLFTAEPSDDGDTYQCFFVIDGEMIYSQIATMHILPQGSLLEINACADVPCLLLFNSNITITHYLVEVVSDHYNATLQANSSISLSNFKASLDCQTLNVSINVYFEDTCYVLERNLYLFWFNGSVTNECPNAQACCQDSDLDKTVSTLGSTVINTTIMRIAHQNWQEWPSTPLIVIVVVVVVVVVLATSIIIPIISYIVYKKCKNRAE